jgi:hypothetical protein
MTEVHQLNISAGSRQDRKVEANETRMTMDREQFVIHVTMKFRVSCIGCQPTGVQSRGGFKLTSTASVKFPPPQTFTTRTRFFYIVGFMTSSTTLWPSPQTPPL